MVLTCFDSLCRPSGEDDPTYGLTKDRNVEENDHVSAIFVETIRDAAGVEDSNTTPMKKYAVALGETRVAITVWQVLLSRGDPNAPAGLLAAQTMLRTLLLNPVAARQLAPGEGTLFEATVAHEIGHGPDPDGRNPHHREAGIMSTGASGRVDGFVPKTLDRFRTTKRW